MKWSWRIGRLAGIDVFVHWTFLLLLIWIGAVYLLRGGNLGTALQGLLIIVAFFGCIVLHELGHALTARRYGIGTRDITLLPIGGVARLDDFPKQPWREFWIAVAGPAVNVAIAGVLALILWWQGNLVLEAPPESLTGTSFLSMLLTFNVVVVLFNLLPAFPMDGGRVLRALLATRFSYVRATRMAANVGQLMAMLFGIMGLFGPNPILLFIAIFVYLGAEAEAQSAQFKASTDNVPVREAMMTNFRILAPDDLLQDAAKELLAGAQQDFPVVEDGRLRGMLCRSDLVRGLSEEGSQMAVGDVMNTELQTADSTETLDGVLTRMRDARCGSVPVMHQDRIIGLLTLENVGELVMVRAALRHEQMSPADAEQFVQSS